MNEDYLDELLNSVMNPESADNNEQLNDDAKTTETEDSMEKKLEQMKKEVADDANAKTVMPELDDDYKDLLGVENLDDIPDESGEELTESEIERLEKLDDLNVEAEPSDFVSAEPEEISDSISLEDLFGGDLENDTFTVDDLSDVFELESENENAGESEDELEFEPETIPEVEADTVLQANIPESVDNSDDSKKLIKKDKSSKKKKDKSDKKSFLSIVKKVFFEEVKDEPDDEPDEKPKNENEQVLQELYGKNTEDGELLSEKNKGRKGFFARLGENLRARKEKALEEERLEEEAEELEAEEKKRQKEEKKAAAQEKREEAKAAKEAAKAKKQAEKAKKPKNEKKPKEEKKPKKPTNPKDILKIKPMSMAMFILFVAGFVILVIMLNDVFNYTQNIKRAKDYMQNGNYSSAYEILHGMELTKSDKAMEEQLGVIMVVERQYESYQNYRKLGMNVEALNALIKGVVQFDRYKDKGEELGVIEPMNAQRQIIIETLLSQYNIDENLATELAALFNEDFTRYYRAMETYGGKTE